ncbi:MAG TPA: transcriptional repressor LexA [Candidatus Bathyarchaeia archaeon]|nr:transcriptional repressor LexA [Candidatus Bathyarchaeia archaeon]
MLTLTKRQKQLLDFLEDYIQHNGFAPTLDETGKHFGLTSLATVHKHLSNLEQKGLIRRRWNHSRALEVVPQRRREKAIELPLLGLVAAGRPIEATLEDEKVAIPESMVPRQSSFVLKVQGDSMRDDGILDGDLIVVESRPAADSGETVVAVLNGAATVKRFHRERGGRIRLQPANERVAPIICREREVEIRGVVVALLRRY